MQKAYARVFRTSFEFAVLFGVPIRTWVKEMNWINASEARKHLPELLDRVARGESLTITRHDKPVAQLVPVGTREEHAQEALDRIAELRQHIKLAPLAELMAMTHEGHRY